MVRIKRTPLMTPHVSDTNKSEIKLFLKKYVIGNKSAIRTRNKLAI